MKDLLQELSRSYMTRQYCLDVTAAGEKKTENCKRRKRKRRSNADDDDDDDVSQQQAKGCFEVRTCPHGIGMFATRDIECGSLIIDREDPIVCAHRAMLTASSEDDTSGSSRSSGKTIFCQYCVAPLGSLRDHLKAPANLPFPYIGKDTGPQFTDDVSLLRKCHDCQQVAWCSEECAKLGRPRHRFLCRRAYYDSKSILDSSSTMNTRNPRQCPLETFYSTVENPSIFQLAVDGMAAILALALREIIQDEHEKLDQSAAGLTSYHNCIFHFWKDYGSHPLWWHIIDSHPSKTKERKSQSQAFVKLLQEFFSLQCQQLSSLQPKVLVLLESTVAELCTRDNIGQLLGMLQCNVMEFEYLSPLGQYLNHLEQEEDQGEHGGQVIDAANNHQEGMQWLHQNTEKLQQGETSIVGSGLYPLLTLANHDCDPNASIDFLQESNRGSMVALRDIVKNEEVCITYVPNGGLDAGGTSERFRHFEPTRTWKWLNQNNDDENDYSECSDASEQKDDHHHQLALDEGGDHEIDEAGDDAPHHNEPNSPQADDSDEDCDVEGAGQGDRSAALLEYGFDCQCKRCLYEKVSPKQPYERVK